MFLSDVGCEVLASMLTAVIGWLSESRIMLFSLKKAVLASSWAAFLVAGKAHGHLGSKPNFIFIITDDQDLHLNSLNYQPAVQRHFAQQGTFFSKHYCTIAICCPSRVSLLTGRAAHNTNVTDVSAPYGGYTKFISEGWNEKYLPVWLQDEGYNTYYTGKLMNGHSTTTYNDPFAKGWTANDFFLDPNTYIYYNVTMQKDQDVPVTYPGEYSTDLAAERSLGFLDDAISKDAPFFIGVAPIGPHAETISGSFNPPVPAKRHKDLFPGLKVPRTENFNPDVSSGASWISQLAQQNQTVVDYNDEFYRARIQSLQAVDDLIESIISRLEKDPLVYENTYLIYTTDNGYHIGQHRLAPGKTCPIEEDYNVPFFIRGPGIGKGKVVSLPTSHTDIVPTLFTLAGIPLQAEFDGEPMPVTAEQLQDTGHRSEHVNLEFWGDSIPEGGYGGSSSKNNTYKSVRVIAQSYDLAYTVWCNNDHEIYDMKSDPGQMNNLHGSAGEVYGWDIEKLTARIDGLLLTLKACKGAVCTRPWAKLHPRGDVLSLSDAMKPAFDDFYVEQQLKVTFTACKEGYLAEFEGALEPVAYD
ncbi:Uu.00g014990.m01.CDS01 [Anthostomella pinea]|uniref:Arylsulfatase n=1 Tax=Anthostomella pinea TaxID=933095 RepID=A0AAI8VZC2_9PEZI|nr:Uu.00g014990.m01.CDS01 [Anthostomella pinea]